MTDLGGFSYVDGEISTSWPAAALKVGKFCSIARGLHCMLGGNHRPECVSTYPFAQMLPMVKGLKVKQLPPNGLPTTKGDIVIGNDVWIGQDVTILSGVKIGDGAVVGAKSVVTKDIPAYAIAAGNPAEVKKYRFDAKTIERMLKCHWWDWPIEKIISAVGLLQGDDLEAFLGFAEA